MTLQPQEACTHVAAGVSRVHYEVWLHHLYSSGTKRIQPVARPFSFFFVPKMSLARETNSLRLLDCIPLEAEPKLNSA